MFTANTFPGAAYTLFRNALLARKDIFVQAAVASLLVRVARQEDLRS